MEPDANLLPRDRLLRDTFTIAETLLFILILLTSAAAFVLAAPRSPWLLGFFLIAGGLAPALLKVHEQTHPFFLTLLWSRFWRCTAPVWLLFVQFALGLLQSPLQVVEIQGERFSSLGSIHPWLPVSTSAGSRWLTLPGFSAIYLVTLCLFIVPKSRAFFERLMPWLCLGAVLIAVFGYIQAAFQLDAPLFTKGTGRSDFFALFSYDGSWAAFATLWTCACIAMALLTTRYDDSPAFIQSSGPWYLTGGVLLGASAFLVDARWPAAVLLLLFSAMLLLVAVNFLVMDKDPHRRPISLLCGLAAIGAFAAGLLRIFGNEQASGASEQLMQAAQAMFRDSPFFGWGMDSYEALLPFYGSDFLVGQPHARAGSDVAQCLAELGLWGVLPPLLLLAILIFRYLRGLCNIQLTNHLLIGCAAVILLAFFDNPFTSPTVFFSFFILLFSALRWADLSRNRADEVDATPPALVAPASQRRTPFHPRPTKG